MRRVRTLASLLILVLLPVLFLWRLTLAGHILVGGDPLNFFYPYHDAVAAALRAGHLPEWNPYLFGGVPFLADSQVQLFYPLSWLFWGLSAPDALSWSVVLHMGIAGVGLYAWARRGLGLGAVGAWVAAVLFALGGYLGAQIEHVNQVAAGAWIPWMLLGYDKGRGTVIDALGNAVTIVADSPHRWRTRAAGALVGAGALGMSLLAGHAQTTFIGLVILGLWAVRWAVRDDARTKANVLLGQRSGGYAPVVAAAWRNFVGVNIVPLVWIVLLGALLGAVQLVPTQMLSGLSTRAGGLEFREAATFSFDPRLALRAFFPTFGQDDPLLSEYVAWVGFSGLALAAVGLWRGRGAAREFGILSSITGLFLAVGGYNPVFWLLWRIVPGFDLFRVPARWLLLWALGVAVLAGVGINALGRGSPITIPSLMADAPKKITPSRWWWIGGGIALLVGVVYLVVADLPALAVLPWWLGVAVLTLALVGGMLWAERRGVGARRLAGLRLGVVAFVVVELWLASWGLGYQGATAADAYSGMRNTVAHLVAETTTATISPAATTDFVVPLPALGTGRILSQSGLTWDPGDLARLQSRYAGQLDDEAIYQLVVATKLKEVLAPNQPMRWGIPSADGYGGGLLPSARWVAFQRSLPLAKVVPDGRLREQLTALPRRELLDTMGVEWLVVDKVMDWWSKGIYHDLGAPRPIATGEAVTWLAPVGASFMAADTISFVVMGVLPTDAGTLTLGNVTLPLAEAQEIAMRTTPRGEERHYRLPLGETVMDATVMTIQAGESAWTLGGITVWHGQLRGFEALAAEPTLRISLSGDVKVYQRTSFPGRAWFAPTAQFVTDAEVAAGFVAESGYDPLMVAIVEQERDVLEVSGGTGSVTWVSESAERIELQVESAEGGWLLLADAPAPGWTVTIDGVAAEWYPANVINRVVLVPVGAHTVVWQYATPGLPIGAVASGVGLLIMIGVGLWAVLRRGR